MTNTYDMNAEIDALPEERRVRIDARAEEIKQEIATLKELRKLAAKSQAEVARRLETSQPAVSRMERGADMFLSTLRGYVESLGGRLDLVVRLPDRPEVRLTGLGDLHAEELPEAERGDDAGRKTG